ncbi:hypothetical protein DZ860_17225 [Vibrio sinensis]|uniref:Inositolphosphotransferase Aur1/Ipt1 domain-containing protein n=2 Tax=Vibrio sinensis TaxID=2302434 RepID=A0A3A6QGL1_9VIBR|nr:hypothetical protein DZ860_17225 [Vibrio sinensis]
MGVVVLGVALFAYLHGHTSRLSLFSYMSGVILVVPVSIMISATIYFFVLACRREPRPLLCYRNKLLAIYECRARIIASFFLLTALSLVISSFSTMKGLIPLVKPFQYDTLFYEMDLWFFFGHSPWELVHSVFDSPYHIMILNCFYNVWFLLLWGCLCYFLLAPPSNNRTQAILSWILCWFFIGTIMAMLLSSAGPAFLENLEPSNQTYAELMERLKNHDIWLKEQGSFGIFAVQTQENLWQAYIQDKEMLGSGISAMPSMHVSIATQMALSVSSVNRKLGWFFWVYLVIIFIGSFALGWHYAVDGLVSIPLTCLIWYLSGKLARRQWTRSSEIRIEPNYS